MEKQMVFYRDGEIELAVSVNDETVWLNRHQIAELFERDVKTIGKHINNVFREGELTKDMVVAKFATTTQHGALQDKTQTRLVEYYNLDVIISVGYRVKSRRGVQFRQWATSILKTYIYNGYAINGNKITHQRFKELENDVAHLKQEIDLLKQDHDRLPPRQGIFFDGQIFDAHVFVSDLIKSAKSSIILIDNYIDESVLTLFTKNQNIDVTIYTHTISKRLRLDLKKYNAQYRPIQIKTLKSSHDRFLILDEQTIYHIGASLKDLGRRWFAFSKIETRSIELLERLG